MLLSGYFTPYQPTFRNNSVSEYLNHVKILEDVSQLESEQIDIAIIGLNEYRPSNILAKNTANTIRKYFYQLQCNNQRLKICDFGNLNNGAGLSDTYSALRDIFVYLYEHKIIPVFIGGNQITSYGIFAAYESMKMFVNLVSVDSKINIGNFDYCFDSYLNKIIQSNSNYLFNFTNIGYQSYFQSKESLQILDSLFFEYHRLGNVRNNIHLFEPTLRDADYMCLSMNAIKQSDSPSSLNPSPNGLSGDEACQISRYAGLCDKLSAFGIFDLSDEHEQSAHLAAQIMWYFIEGVSMRKNEFPGSNNPNIKKFIVNLNEEHQLIFYKSSKTDRWWVEVPYMKIKERNMIVSCTYDDYLQACNHEIPDKWWKTYQKIN
jgi:formiminoglutamase